MKKLLIILLTIFTFTSCGLFEKKDVEPSNCLKITDKFETSKIVEFHVINPITGQTEEYKFDKNEISSPFKNKKVGETVCI